MEASDSLVVDPVISLLSLLENGSVALTGTRVEGDEGRYTRGKWSIDEIDNRLHIHLEQKYTGKYLYYTISSMFTGEICEDAGKAMYIKGTMYEDNAGCQGKFVMMPTSSSFKSKPASHDVAKMLLAL